MPELLRIKTEDFLFTVKTTSIDSRQQALERTLQARQHKMIEQQVKLVPAAFLIEKPRILAESDPECIFPTEYHSIELPTPLFYENTQYLFEWIFFKKVEKASLAHRLKRICESFIFSPSEEGISARLTGSINTGNDVGWMRLPLLYERDGKAIRQDTAFEVLPTKMVMHQDLPIMYQDIDPVFPLWRFSLAQSTEMDVAKGLQRGNFPLMWLANFSQLRKRFEQGLKVISQAPHSRLQSHITHTKAARLKGRIPHKLGAKVKEDLESSLYDKRYRVERKQLSMDTPENRFIKMVVTQSKKQLADFEQRLRTSNKAPDKQRLSDTFLDELHSWQQPLQKLLNQSFLKEVGAYSGSNRESLVLQQKTGYSAVYRVWQELKFYLDIFANQSSISMKSVAEVYEVWCFLSLKNTLQEELGFELVSNSKANLSLNEFFEYQLKDGFAGAFEFKRADGVTARLAHEPVFTKKGKTIRSYLVNQEPDIVLEVTLPATEAVQASKRFIWLFDAKYRIKTDKNRFDVEDIDTTDYVPDDAINQMHRYRDALIRLTENSVAGKNVEKSRPVFGAFALYPGYFDQKNDTNPYAEAIREIGIGAFALLPNTNDIQGGNAWLVEFLKEQIGHAASYSADSMSERLYVQDAARIPYHGMQQVLYPDLTMTVALGGQKGRDNNYFDAFKQGTAEWYHIPQKTFLAKFKQHVVNEIRYLALAITSDQNSTTKQVDKLWPVKKVVVLPRYAITEQQAGKASGLDELYYLFELARPLTLQAPVSSVPHRPVKNSMKLTTLNKLEKVQLFSQVEWVYREALV